MNYQPVNLSEKLAKFSEQWSPKIIAQMNDYHFKIAKIEGEFIWHDVKIEEGTRLADIYGEPIIKVNSLHHQGLKDIASSLRVTGYSSDGLVEAVELADHPFGLAVQWHPEWLTEQESTRNLFSKFVEAAAQR